MYERMSTIKSNTIKIINVLSPNYLSKQKRSLNMNIWEYDWTHPLQSWYISLKEAQQSKNFKNHNKFINNSKETNDFPPLLLPAGIPPHCQSLSSQQKCAFFSQPAAFFPSLVERNQQTKQAETQICDLFQPGKISK